MKSKLLCICLLLISISCLAQTPAFWESHGIGGGGALFSPSVNPSNPDEIYVSCDMGEVFHSTNGGTDWNMIDYMQVQGGHESQVQFTNNPLIKYVVDYTSIQGMDFIRPLKSIDGGSTWQLISGNPYPSAPDAGVLRLLADYINPDNIILAGYGTIYFSSDGGSNFHLVHTCISNGAGNHIAGAFFDSSSIYIGTNDGLLVSADNGQTFNTMSVSGIPSGEYILSFAGAKQDGHLKFYCLTTTSVWAGFTYGDNYWGEMSGVYNMDNADGSWHQAMGGIASGSDFPVFVGMSANNTGIAYLAGGSSVNYPIVMKSVAGAAWTHVFLTASNQNIYTGWSGFGGDHGWSYPEAPFGFTVDRNDANTLMFSDYGGVHITKDAGLTWHQKYLDPDFENPMGQSTPIGKSYHGNGLENTSCWQLLWADSLSMYGGYSDITGIYSVDKGYEWKFIPGLTQNTIYRLVKNTDGKIYAATSSIHDMYQSTRIYDAQINSGTGAVYFAPSNGGNFSLLHNFGHPVTWIAIDPANPGRMYASVAHSNKATIGGIYVTNNLEAGSSSTWTKMPNPPEANGHPFNITVLNNGDLVVSYSARKPSSSKAFTDSSGVFYYNNLASTWSKRSDPNMRFWTQDVVVDPNDPTQSTWYSCVFNGWGTTGINGTGGLFRTYDKGLTWNRISDEYRVNSCTIDPLNPNRIYMTTETNGLWFSNDASSAQPGFNRVPEYPFRHPVRVFYNPFKQDEIWVTGFGAGVMKGVDGDPNSISPSIQSKAPAANVYPNPAKNLLNVDMLTPHDRNLVFELFDLPGKKLFERSLEQENQIDLSVFNLAAGIYLYSILESGKVVQHGKLLIH
ncbi:MAG: T9SS type A sorting domain-containing protein [Bacteroidetes bacterium]|nr:T9SS type A sorting domain-containing protein [Bacteroidota bacterium]